MKYYGNSFRTSLLHYISKVVFVLKGFLHIGKVLPTGEEGNLIKICNCNRFNANILSKSTYELVDTESHVLLNFI